MTDEVRRASAPELQRAAHWFIRHDSGSEITDGERREWEAWYSDEKNRVAYNLIYRTQYQFKRLPRPSLPTDEELQAHGNGGETSSLSAKHTFSSQLRRIFASVRTTLTALARMWCR
jgi:ferric-dicitrate binding protein FerR (iron transport regulator)